MSLQTVDLSEQKPPMQLPQKQQMSKQMATTYAICIGILVIVIVILIVVICIRMRQRRPHHSQFEGYNKLGKKREKYQPIETSDGLITYSMNQKDGKIFGDIKYGKAESTLIHPFVQEYFRPMSEQFRKVEKKTRKSRK